MFGKKFMRCLCASLIVIGSLLATGCQLQPDIQHVDTKKEYGEICNIDSAGDEWYVVYRVQEKEQLQDAIYIERHTEEGEKETLEAFPMSEETTKFSNFVVGDALKLYAFKTEKNKEKSLICKENNTAEYQMVSDKLEYTTQDGKVVEPDGYFLTEKNEIVLYYKEIKNIVVLDENGNFKVQKEFPEYDFDGISYVGGNIVMKHEQESYLCEIVVDDLSCITQIEMHDNIPGETYDKDYFFMGKKQPEYFVYNSQIYDIKTGESLLGTFYEGEIDDSTELRDGVIVGETMLIQLHQAGSSHYEGERVLLNLDDDSVLKYAIE